MKIACRRPILVNFIYLGLATLGSTGVAARAGAQNVDAPPSNQSASLAGRSTQSADSTADEKLLKRVKDALHSDPYFYDEHVTVSVEKGVVVLRGFVFNDRDLQDALRIARKAAGDKPVRGSLSIERGGP